MRRDGWIVGFLAWLGSLAVLAPVCSLGAFLLAGPHSSLLPSFLQGPAWLLAWIILLVVPALVGRAAWRRAGRGAA